MIPVRVVHVDKGSKVEGYTDNLSAGGCLMIVNRGDSSPFESSSLCEVDLGLPDGKVFLVGKVLRRGLNRDGDETLALQFVSVAPADQDRIARFVLHAEIRSRQWRNGEEKKSGGGGLQG